MKCKLCRTEIPEGQGEFCSSEHELKYLNSLRLTFWPSFSTDNVAIGYESREEAESLIDLQSRAGLMKLVQDLSPEEKVFRANQLQKIIVHMMTLVYSEKNRDDIINNAKLEAEAKLKIAKGVAQRDKRLIDSASATRAKNKLLQEGKKVSKDGACSYCNGPSIAEFCSEEHKSAQKIIESLMKAHMSEEQARAYAETTLKGLKKTSPASPAAKRQ